jgi:hypothetical protein
MSTDPWTADDPQPGDFDEELDGSTLEYSNGEVRVVVALMADDGDRMRRMADARGLRPHELVAELLRDADRPAE